MSKTRIIETLFELAIKNGPEFVTIDDLSRYLGNPPNSIARSLHTMGIETTTQKRIPGTGARTRFIVFDLEAWQKTYYSYSNDEKYSSLLKLNICGICDKCRKGTLIRHFVQTFDGKGVTYKCNSCSTTHTFPVIKGTVQRKKPRERVPAIKITCPYCEKVHTHSSYPLPDLRRSHCAPGPIPGHCWPDPAPASRSYWIIPDVIVGKP